MGISANQFWATSKNGKAMIVFLAKRGDIEIVRDICEWLVVERQKGLYTQAKQKGANDNQAKIVARDGVARLDAIAQSINDRNVEGNAIEVVDAIFRDHLAAGQASYEKVMAWLSDRLRERVKD